VYNDTGTTWDFVPQQGGGAAEWHIYEGARDGEPLRPYSLGQIYSAGSPDAWLLGFNVLADVYYGTAVVGGYLKNADGQIALAFCIQDAASGTREMYAVEADSASNQISLVRWVNGARTKIATADFTFDHDEEIWIGADWRDFDDEDRIKVYATLSDEIILQAKNLVISATDSNVERGSYVGVMSYEANARFFDFRAGSPQHAMTSEVSYFARLAANVNTPWQDWTPTVDQDGAVAATVTAAQYCVMGESCLVRAILNVTGAGAAGNAIVISGQPAAVQAAAGGILGAAMIWDNGAGFYVGVAYVQAATDWRIFCHNETNAAGISPNFALANGDVIYLSLSYKRA